ncbi:MAG: hypothetical protein B6241_03825 [Spirochaetaceae bacterium 4572_59]|nr:MAG: hypothetical protein B6241_03825 [Spirochaetaceae bacterium 4572_59]
MSVKAVCFLLIFSFFPFLLVAEYPEIQSTSAYKDPIFKQQQKETETWYLHNVRGLPPPPLTIYCYKPSPEDSLIQLAATFNLTIDTIATLNMLQNINDFDPDRTLLIPSSPGLFIPQDHSSSWFDNLEKSLHNQDFQSIALPLEKQLQNIHYYPGEYLPADIRSRFVRHIFLPPLDKLYITSPYGYRDHPFTGKWELHIGTDYRAAIGTNVKSCGDGEILFTGELDDYGKSIIIQHRNGYTSTYGHLSSILVRRGGDVLEGDIIGKSGNTGYSTGPHLHFEIRKNGLPQNPENLLSKSGK